MNYTLKMRITQSSLSLFVNFTKKYVILICLVIQLLKTQLIMSQEQSSTVTGPSTSSKPITAAFDLETKIRTIIQDVLSATMRKLSQFNQKVETFEKFFFTYTQRINDIDEKGKTNEQSLMRMFDTMTKNKENSESEMIKMEERHERLKIEKNQLNEEVKQITRKIGIINRQNQSINNDFSNTKKKFLEYSQQMTTLKEEVAWKITRYVEETAEINTKIQINNEDIKKEYFNINLALEKNKQKYEEIISTRDKQENINNQMKQAIQNMELEIKQKSESITTLNKKLEQMDTALYSKIKLTESKLERRLDQLIENNQKIEKSVSKVDGFSKLLEEIREDSEKIRRQLMKKFEETDQKHTDRLEKQVLGINMNILNYEKATDKKIRSITETQQKNVQFFNQKMEYLKIQIETQISSKATKMLEQKSKSQSGVANSALQQFEQRINKLTLDTKKQINKVENLLKDVRTEVKHQVEDMKDTVETRISNTMKAIEESSGSGVSPEFVEVINKKIEKVVDANQLKIFEFGQEIGELTQKVKAVYTMKQQTEEKFKELIEENVNKFAELDEKISAKVERVLFTVTKMRGDAIIRNEFTDKEIKQLKKVTETADRSLATVMKLMPAIGECINLTMCLIYDAEYQHAKIIQDNLPTSSKNVVKFQNLVEGVLYEYSEKKKPGTITYRHKEQKKIDIVRATFNGYIQIWEDLFDNDFKSKQEFIPKTFYKKYIEKNVGLSSRGGNSPNKELGPQANPSNSSKQVSPNKDKILSDDSRNMLRGVASDASSENMNKSFHIRKKKISTIKSKDDLIMVVQEDAKQQK